ncbi:hypothetical protein Pmani_029656 [Petrolisthes manimaculis]|uniref:Uncharacterized protein n=1 Tax=Petrolisthes manimaculis TaxID=1843537 RepID=A0AAE1NYZ9_9EUCA|nr:hypothetical protein Pmani_029656 [Petrolisthes manimaculis]
MAELKSYSALSGTYGRGTCIYTTTRTSGTIQSTTRGNNSTREATTAAVVLGVVEDKEEEEKTKTKPWPRIHRPNTDDFTLTRLDRVDNRFIRRQYESEYRRRYKKDPGRMSKDREGGSNGVSIGMGGGGNGVGVGMGAGGNGVGVGMGGGGNSVGVSGGNVVVVQQAYKHYGRGKKKVVVLDRLDMRVPQGAIYGLLGPSGCGKTTLLGCLVSRLALDSGEVLLYGYPTGSPQAAVPGHRVGYMPQELALYREFTIGETLSYFGRIHHMSSSLIRQRTHFLLTFLDLPDDPTRLVNQLSGGQQRRVSLGAALLHQPELLILDEPTVGVDPLLRTSIWQHLLDVCKGGNTTIIITTHYIEEARQADKIGLMRGGRLLAETSPSSLIQHFNNPSLEDIFLKLCLQDGDKDNLQHQAKSNKGYDHDDEKDDPHTTTTTTTTIPLPEARGTSSELHRDVNPSTGHVILRDTTDDKIIMSPWLETSRYERAFSLGRFSALMIKNFTRLYRNLGFLLFSFLMPPIQTALFCLTVGGTPYNLPMAIVDDDQGFQLDVQPPVPVLPNISLDFNFSSMYLDELSDRTIDKRFYKTFEAGYESVKDGTTWGLIYFNETFTQSLLSLLTIGSLDAEDKEHSKIHVYMDNTSVQSSEVMLAHLATQMLVMLVQIALILVFMFPVFQLPCEGNMIWVVLISVLQGFCGMTFGLMTSAISNDENTAIMMALGIFYPLILLSGIVWPIEGMPTGLRYVSYILPQTYACNSIRAILYKGWDITYSTVYLGYLITTAWLFIHLAITLIAIRIRK